ncbi:muramoyltetrapeptide carboxypeptidase [Luteibacter rhizovicinus]|uniref:Muramoyltetrapeptide carboxypeptidase n=1 Tax=Luteibacter rhizovicinus TaxID=242606 RepID=A0A4R3YGA8_9GAMM|nr:LD-carboxypeptidase [Luteibacter rhizovicinus]TCV91180.1 muramoyltetrapeptide carboxypeptidase [Luteibacter rhizovicinus]
MPKRFDIRIIAPSGYAEDRAACQRAIERLEAAGHKVSGGDIVDRIDLRFAGNDEQRASDINAIADPDRPVPDIFLAAHGGYGAIAILDRLDYRGIRERLLETSTVLVGHGDFTVLQAALYARCGLTSMHGPMLASDFGAGFLRDSTWRHFWHTVQSPTTHVAWQVPDDVDDVQVEGTLWGGNLSAICSLLGTSYFPCIDDGILFIEESGEHAFRIERMLFELKLAGVLDAQRAIIVGSLGGQRISEYDNGYDTDHALRRAVQGTLTPLLRGISIGHGMDKVTLPFGGRAALEVIDGTASLEVSRYRYADQASAPRAMST